ncbi:MAG: O-antigen ligase family protein [Actinobacteria bacterium]|nr:O-antigen ligase family protein [Actinomycetota bacterium]
MTTAARGRLARRGPGPYVIGAGAAGAVAAGLAVGSGQPIVLVAGLAGLAGAALLVLDERWAIGTLSAFVVLHLAEVATDFHGAPSLLQPLIGVLLLGVAARWAATGTRPSGIGGAVLLVGAYVGVAVGSLLFAAGPVDPFADAQVLLKDAGLAIVAGLLLSRASSLRVAAWAMVAAGGVLAALSVFQFATGTYGSAYGGLAQSSVEQIVGTYDDIRISGPIGDPNFYGQLLVTILPLALDRMWGERRLLLRVAGGGAAALISAAAVLTFSRGTAVALVAVLVMMALVYRPSLKSMAAVALAGALAIPFLPPGYTERLLTLSDVGTVQGSTDASIRGRTAELTAGWLMFADHPLTGVGYGQYDENYQDYVAGLGIELRSEDRDAHSFYLEIAAETGLPGVLAMGAVLAGAFVALRRSRRSFEAAGLDGPARTSRALAASLVGFLITALFLHHDYSRPFWVIVGLALAMPALASREASLAAEAAPEEVTA